MQIKTAFILFIAQLFVLLHIENRVQQIGMKLILLTSADFFIEEDMILTTLFEEGLDILHLRKPDSEPVYCERLLTLIPEQYHPRIVVHDHFYLREEFGLMGIHLSRRNPQLPPGYSGPVTRTCYSLDEVERIGQQCQYIFLRNVFDSISEPENRATFTEAQLRDAARRGIIGRRVMAEGGVALENIPRLRDLGFGGVVVRGDLWKRFNIHSGCDFRELIDHFRRLRKATS